MGSVALPADNALLSVGSVIEFGGSVTRNEGNVEENEDGAVRA